MTSDEELSYWIEIEKGNRFTREELWLIIKKAVPMSQVPFLSERWRDVYQALADAADTLDALMARAELEALQKEEEE